MFKSGEGEGAGYTVHEKSDLPEAFHKRSTREFLAWSPGVLPSPDQKNEFRIGGDAISNYKQLYSGIFI